MIGWALRGYACLSELRPGNADVLDALFPVLESHTRRDVRKGLRPKPCWPWVFKRSTDGASTKTSRRSSYPGLVKAKYLEQMAEGTVVFRRSVSRNHRVLLL
jgi:hypothetical protein